MISLKKGINIFHGNEMVYSSILRFLSEEYNTVEFYNSDEKNEVPYYTTRKINNNNYKEIIDANMFKIDLISIKIKSMSQKTSYKIYEYLLSKDLPILLFTDDVYEMPEVLERYLLEIDNKSIGSSLSLNVSVKLKDHLFITDSKGNTSTFESFMKSFLRDRSIDLILKN